MGDEISKLDRDILYQLCQWGVGNDLGSWFVPQFLASMPFSNGGMTVP